MIPAAGDGAEADRPATRSSSGRRMIELEILKAQLRV